MFIFLHNLHKNMTYKSFSPPHSHHYPTFSPILSHIPPPLLYPNHAHRQPVPPHIIPINTPPLPHPLPYPIHYPTLTAHTGRRHHDVLAINARRQPIPPRRREGGHCPADRPHLQPNQLLVHQRPSSHLTQVEGSRRSRTVSKATGRPARLGTHRRRSGQGSVGPASPQRRRCYHPRLLRQRHHHRVRRLERLRSRGYRLLVHLAV